MKRAARGALVVFAKAPRAGEVKTRMCPPLTPAEAAELYASLLADVLAASARIALRLELEPLVAVHPPGACAALAKTAPTGFRAVKQRGRDLSARMTWAVREAAAWGASPILLRGSDSPLLDEAAIAEALAALAHDDVSVCPDRDGGYALVGLRVPAPGLFDHAMSTRSVLDDTLARARALGLRVHVQSPGFDLDTAADLRRLAEARAQDAPACARLCPRTLAVLDSRELWRHAGLG